MYPVLFDFFGSKIYSYPLFLGLAWGIGYNLSSVIFKDRWSFKAFNLFFLLIFISSWIGAKLFFLFFSEIPVEIYASKMFLLSQTSFWLGGGFVFLGGLVAALLFMLLFVFVYKKASFRDLTLLLPSVCFSHAIGRIGCLFAGCCYGTETDFFINIFLHNARRHPVQLYESILLTILGIVLLRQIKKKIHYSWHIVTYFASYSVLRFFLEFIRGDDVRGIYIGNLSTSQWLSILILIIVLAWFILLRRFKNEV